jgi:hypothetical protein
MLKQIAAVSQPWSLQTNKQLVRMIAQSRNARSAVLLSISRPPNALLASLGNRLRLVSIREAV